MGPTLAETFNLYVFPTGRRQWTHARIAELARARSLDDLAAHCEAAVAHDERTRTLRRTLDTARAMPANPRLTELDAAIDRSLGAIYRICTEAGLALGPDFQAPADTLRRSVFPNGAVALTLLPWVEQVTEVQSVITLLDDDHLETVQALGLTPWVTRLRDLHTEFAAALTHTAPADLTADDLRARDAAGQDLLLETVARVLGTYPRATKADTRARAELLAPLYQQSEAIRQRRRTRRTPTDIDPTTEDPTDIDPTPPSPA